MPFDCIADVLAIFPRTETLIYPVKRCLGTISSDRFAQNCGARLALLGSKLIEPLDVIFRKIGEDAGHGDILISYHDIMSSRMPSHLPSRFFRRIAS
ncbi:hypothetical protein IP68_02890 [Blastomonas sp. AAP25]|nr:hypothetical protein IP68_02890 [Blastomonas sp. AAP25]